MQILTLPDARSGFDGIATKVLVGRAQMTRGRPEQFRRSLPDGQQKGPALWPALFQSILRPPQRQK
jgi:hypothetical protein